MIERVQDWSDHLKASIEMAEMASARLMAVASAIIYHNHPTQDTAPGRSLTPSAPPGSPRNRAGNVDTFHLLGHPLKGAGKGCYEQQPQDVNSRDYWEWAVNNPVEAN